MKMYRGFPRRLHHEVPGWVESGSIFHIRIAINRDTQRMPLTAPPLAGSILASVQKYDQQLRWYVRIFVLMPDHLHAVLSFTADKSMSSVLGDWKRFHARNNHVAWEEGYFDHRLRNDERGEQLASKWLTSGETLWLLVCARTRKIGHGFTRRPTNRSEVDQPLRGRCEN